MYSPAHDAENGRRVHGLAQGLNDHPANTPGHASLPPNLLAPPPRRHPGATGHTSSLARETHQRDGAETTCKCAKLVVPVLCVLMCMGPSTLLARELYVNFAKLCEDQPVILVGLGTILVMTALRRARLRKTATRQQEARVRHARALRRAGEARIGSSGSSARLTSDGYLRVASDVNAAVVPRPPAQTARQALLLSPQRPVPTEPSQSRVVDGFAVFFIRIFF